MSDLLKYGVSLQYSNFRKTLAQTKKSVKNFNKMQEIALKRQIALRKQLESSNAIKAEREKAHAAQERRITNNLKDELVKRRKLEQNARIRQAVGGLTQKTGAENYKKFYQQQSKEALAQHREEQKLLTKWQKEYDRADQKKLKEREKQHKADLKLQQSIQRQRVKDAVKDITASSGAESMRKFYKEQERMANKAHTQELKRQQQIQNAKVKSAVQGITRPNEGRGDMVKFYQEQERAQRKMLDEAYKMNKAEDRRIEQLEKAKHIVNHSAMMQGKLKTREAETLRLAIKTRIEKAKTAEEVRRIVREERRRFKIMNKQHFLVERMRASTMQIAGNMASAFAASAAGVAITTTGQNFESVQATMKAVSSDSQEAEEQMEFLRNEAVRLGISLTEVGKGFAKMLSARGTMSLEDTQNAFTGVAEMSTLLGLSAPEAGRAINALQQMMSKGTVTAEELKLQMGEVLPNAIQIMAEATKDAGLSTNGTVKELWDLMQAGEVASTKVLPHFAKRLREAAQNNGALEDKLKSNRVAMNQMMVAAQNTADLIFRSGWSEGLTDLFKSITKMLVDNKGLWKSVGRIMGSVFKAIAHGINFINEHVMQPLGSALNSITNALTSATTNLSALILGLLASFSPVSRMVGGLLAKFGGLQRVMMAIGWLVRRLLFPLIMVLGVLEEIAEFFAPTGKKTLLGFTFEDVLKGTEKSPFVKWKDELEQVKQLVLDIFSIITGQKYAEAMDKVTSKVNQVKSEGGVVPYGLQSHAQKSGSYSYITQRPTSAPVIQVAPAPVELTIDGEKVASTVTSTQTFQDSTEQVVDRKTMGNTF